MATVPDADDGVGSAAVVVDGRPFVVRAVTPAEVLPLRHRVLRPGLPAESAVFDGDDEPTTRHFAALDGREVVSCLTLVLRPYRDRPARQLRGMATRPDLERRGLGSRLLRFAETTPWIADGPPLLWCNARLPAAGFYQRLGWTIVSEPFDIPGVGPHYVMLRMLAGPARTPP